MLEMEGIMLLYACGLLPILVDSPVFPWVMLYSFAKGKLDGAFLSTT